MRIKNFNYCLFFSIASIILLLGNTSCTDDMETEETEMESGSNSNDNDDSSNNSSSDTTNTTTSSSTNTTTSSSTSSDTTDTSSTSSSTTSGGTGSGTDSQDDSEIPLDEGSLTRNGNFDHGSLGGWAVYPSGNSIIESTDTVNNGGTHSGHVKTGTTLPSNPVIKQEFIAKGVVKGGDKIVISFDMRGSMTSDIGAVVAPKLISEGVDPNATGYELAVITEASDQWKTYNYSHTFSANEDLDRGMSFELAVICGGAAGCVAEIFFDNIVVSIE